MHVALLSCARRSHRLRPPKSQGRRRWHVTGGRHQHTFPRKSSSRVLPQLMRMNPKCPEQGWATPFGNQLGLSCFQPHLHEKNK